MKWDTGIKDKEKEGVEEDLGVGEIDRVTMLMNGVWGTWLKEGTT